MELREFAEQVLFATTLEEKLRRPDLITDERPGPARATPQAPGRPPELRFKLHDSGKADFPGVQRLEEERERGRLLHFFANHELLATELMALVLLRFPDAPAAFRRGVLQTLKDEQLHTRLYLERMRECGIQFGDLPVSGYFWRAVSGMENPMDYVAGLSLTFEQANLDFCRFFARGFGAVGDSRTATLLDRIYHDEIGHVAYGLKWFRRWKNPQESDWEAFCRQLKFPLSPQRAKGRILNIEGRRAAGLDPEFIDELNVYAQSKGRTPNVFVFNPFAEGRIAYGKAFNPVKHQAMLAGDLANLPQFLCRRDDVVLVARRPSVQFLSAIKQAGFALPEFVELSRSAGLWPGHSAPLLAAGSETGAPAAAPPAGLASLIHRKLGRLRPWAWGPDSVELLAPLFPSVTGEQRTASQRFNEGIAQLYSKAWSAALLRKVLARYRRSDEVPTQESQISNLKSQIPDRLLTSAATGGWLCTELEVGVTVDSLAGALEAIDALRQRGRQKVVVKQALGLAGHNAIRLWEPEVLETQRRWMARAVQNGRQLVIEPWLERELDFSIQLEMTRGGLRLCGYTGLINDRKGQFQANWAAPNYDRRPPSQVADLLRGGPGSAVIDGSSQLQRLYAEVFRLLEEALRRADYLGPVGIDAFVYRTALGGCQVKPIVEINPRYTMGRLTVELMKQTCPGSCGLFRIVNRAMSRARGFGDFAAYARSLSERFPLRLEGEPVPKIREGALCLNDPAQAEGYLAVFHVGGDLDALVRSGSNGGG
ncbi:MAG: DUF455 family protein [Verrucomicrobia bacterium]|nr:DUF455 family protein [Verrucomicrobiota bacterium]